MLKTGVICKYCDAPVPAAFVTRDHLVPRCRGGKLSSDNRVLCCQVCNNLKANRPFGTIERARDYIQGKRRAHNIPVGMVSTDELSALRKNMGMRKLYDVEDSFQFRSELTTPVERKPTLSASIGEMLQSRKSKTAVCILGSKETGSNGTQSQASEASSERNHSGIDASG